MAKSKTKSAKKSGTKSVKKTAAAKTKVKAKPASKPKAKAKIKTKAKTKSVGKVKATPKAKAKAKAKAKSAKLKTTGKAAAGLTGAGLALGAAALAAKSRSKSHENIAAIFSPLDDRLIIEQVEAATRTAGGLFIPDTVEGDDRPKQGKVLAVGRGHQNKKGKIQPLDVKLGDIVLFEGFMGSPLKFGSRECVVIRESQILGIVRA